MSGCVEPFAAALPVFVFPLGAPVAANMKCKREHTQDLVFRTQHAKEPAKAAAFLQQSVFALNRQFCWDPGSAIWCQFAVASAAQTGLEVLC